MHNLSEIIWGATYVIWVFACYSYVGVLVWYLKKANTGASPLWHKLILLVFPLTLVTRLVLFTTFEVPRLNQLVRSHEYAQWTRSFQLEPTDSAIEFPASPSPWRGVFKTWQYQSFLVVGVLMSLSLATIVVGAVIQRPHLYTVSLLGTTLALETGFRVGTEACWHVSLSFRKQSSAKRPGLLLSSRDRLRPRQVELSPDEQAQSFTHPIYFDPKWTQVAIQIRQKTVGIKPRY
jgi:hypothetical protein